MSLAFVSIPDPENYITKLTSVADADAVEYCRILDAYAQWQLRWGWDFDLSQQMGKEANADFRIVDKIETLTGDAQLYLQERSAEVPTDTDLPMSQDLVTYLPLRARSLSTNGGGQASGPYVAYDGIDPNKTIIIGVIDDAINICHQRLRSSDMETRVDYAWIQDADASESPAAVPFGREWTKPEIDEMLRTRGADEDAMFRQLGLVSDRSKTYRPCSLNRRMSHGTFVADLAAGDAYDAPNALDKRLITVQLPMLATLDTSGASLVAAVRLGAKYIYDRALGMSQSLGVPVPVVINLSYGFSGGARTGQHLLERALRALALDYREATGTVGQLGAPVERVMPAGNNHLARAHATSQGTANFAMDLRLQPEDRTSSYLEIWYPQTATDIALDITAPDGSKLRMTHANLVPGETGTVRQSKLLVLKEQKDSGLACQPVCRASLDAPNPPPAGSSETLYWRVLLAFAPTQAAEFGRPSAPHGVWHIETEAHAQGAAITNLHAWIQRDDALSGFPPLGRQAYFESAIYDDASFDPLGDVAVTDLNGATNTISRDLTVNGMASNAPLANEPADAKLDGITVGSSRNDTLGATAYSTAGQTSGATGLGPHVLAPAESARALPGVLASGSKSSTRVAAGGTSVSAPQITRLLADTIQELDPSKRSAFDSRAWLLAQTHGGPNDLFVAPERPDTAHPELLSQPQIRPARLQEGGLVYRPKAATPLDDPIQRLRYPE